MLVCRNDDSFGAIKDIYIIEHQTFRQNSHFSVKDLKL